MESWKIKFFKDMYMMKVFESVHNSPKSAQQISEECNISRSTVYKKTQDASRKEPNTDKRYSSKWSKKQNIQKKIIRLWN